MVEFDATIDGSGKITLDLFIHEHEIPPHIFNVYQNNTHNISLSSQARAMLNTLFRPILNKAAKQIEKQTGHKVGNFEFVTIIPKNGVLILRYSGKVISEKDKKQSILDKVKKWVGWG